MTGGTGSLSESEFQPDFMPDKFESGTMNILGISGLNEGVKFVTKLTLSQIQKDENTLVEKLVEGLSNIPKVRVLGSKNRVGVVSFSVEGRDSIEIANELDRRFNIACRGGCTAPRLHINPWALLSMGLRDSV